MIACLGRRWKEFKFQLRMIHWHLNVAADAVKDEAFQEHVRIVGPRQAARDLVDAANEVANDNLNDNFVTVHHADGTKSYKKKGDA